MNGYHKTMWMKAKQGLDSVIVFIILLMKINFSEI